MTRPAAGPAAAGPVTAGPVTDAGSTAVPAAVPYTGGTLDRVPGRRRDPRWVTAVAVDPDAVVVPLWRDACLLDGARPARRTGDAARAVLDRADQWVVLGLDGATPVLAADLSACAEPEAVALAGATGTGDLRRLVGGLPAADATTIAYARGILRWHRTQRFCGVCGSPTVARDGGHLRRCEGCGAQHFPRIEPAVLVLVEAPGPPARCLLGRHRGAAPDGWSTLAGFVEIGEGLEDAVRREVAEEAGVRVDAVTYRASQAWPFPAGLMIGFRAMAVDEDVAVDADELEEARWFTRDEVAAMAATGSFGNESIETVLVRAWLAEG